MRRPPNGYRISNIYRGFSRRQTTRSQAQLAVQSFVDIHGADILGAIRLNDVARLHQLLADHLHGRKQISDVITTTIPRTGCNKIRSTCPLMAAARQRDPATLRYLLKNGVDAAHVHISSRRRNGKNITVRADCPLHVAVRLNRLDNIEALLDHDADANVVNSRGDTALMLACRRGNAPATRLLLAHGADAAILDRTGNSAVHIAAARGFLQCMKALMEYHVDTRQPNRKGFLPVHVAAQQGNVHVVQVLCVRDIGNVCARTSSEMSTDSALLDCGVAAPENSAALYQCPLHLAAENAHVETVTALLDLFSAEPDVRDSHGNSALHHLVLHSHRKHIMRSDDCFSTTASTLIKYHTILDEPNNAGERAIELADKNGYEKIVQLLVAEGVTLERPSSLNQSNYEDSQMPGSAGLCEEASNDHPTHPIKRKQSIPKHVCFSEQVRAISPENDVITEGFLHEVAKYDHNGVGTVPDSFNPFMAVIRSIDDEIDEEKSSNPFAHSGRTSPPPRELASPEPHNFVDDVPGQLKQELRADDAPYRDEVSKYFNFTDSSRKQQTGRNSLLVPHNNFTGRSEPMKSSLTRTKDGFESRIEMAKKSNGTENKLTYGHKLSETSPPNISRPYSSSESLSKPSTVSPEFSGSGSLPRGYTRLDNRKARADFFSTRTLQVNPPDTANIFNRVLSPNNLMISSPIDSLIPFDTVAGTSLNNAPAVLPSTEIDANQNDVKYGHSKDGADVQVDILKRTHLETLQTVRPVDHVDEGKSASVPVLVSLNVTTSSSALERSSNEMSSAKRTKLHDALGEQSSSESASSSSLSSPTDRKDTSPMFVGGLTKPAEEDVNKPDNILAANTVCLDLDSIGSPSALEKSAADLDAAIQEELENTLDEMESGSDSDEEKEALNRVVSRNNAEVAHLDIAKADSTTSAKRSVACIEIKKPCAPPKFTPVMDWYAPGKASIPHTTPAIDSAQHMQLIKQMMQQDTTSKAEERSNKYLDKKENGKTLRTLETITTAKHEMKYEVSSSSAVLKVDENSDTEDVVEPDSNYGKSSREKFKSLVRRFESDAVTTSPGKINDIDILSESPKLRKNSSDNSKVAGQISQKSNFKYEQSVHHLDMQASVNPDIKIGQPLLTLTDFDVKERTVENNDRKFKRTIPSYLDQEQGATGQSIPKTRPLPVTDPNRERVNGNSNFREEAAESSLRRRRDRQLASPVHSAHLEEISAEVPRTSAPSSDSKVVKGSRLPANATDIMQDVVVEPTEKIKAESSSRRRRNPQPTFAQDEDISRNIFPSPPPISAGQTKATRLKRDDESGFVAESHVTAISLDTNQQSSVNSGFIPVIGASVLPKPFGYEDSTSEPIKADINGREKDRQPRSSSAPGTSRRSRAIVGREMPDSPATDESISQKPLLSGRANVAGIVPELSSNNELGTKPAPPAKKPKSFKTKKDEAQVIVADVATNHTDSVNHEAELDGSAFSEKLIVERSKRRSREKQAVFEPIQVADVFIAQSEAPNDETVLNETGLVRQTVRGLKKKSRAKRDQPEMTSSRKSSIGSESGAGEDNTGDEDRMSINSTGSISSTGSLTRKKKKKQTKTTTDESQSANSSFGTGENDEILMDNRDDQSSIHSSSSRSSLVKKKKKRVPSEAGKSASSILSQNVPSLLAKGETGQSTDNIFGEEDDYINLDESRSSYRIVSPSPIRRAKANGYDAVDAQENVSRNDVGAVEEFALHQDKLSQPIKKKKKSTASSLEFVEESKDLIRSKAAIKIKMNTGDDDTSAQNKSSNPKEKNSAELEKESRKSSSKKLKKLDIGNMDEINIVPYGVMISPVEAKDSFVDDDGNGIAFTPSNKLYKKISSNEPPPLPQTMPPGLPSMKRDSVSRKLSVAKETDIDDDFHFDEITDKSNGEQALSADDIKIEETTTPGKPIINSSVSRPNVRTTPQTLKDLEEEDYYYRRNEDFDFEEDEPDEYSMDRSRPLCTIVELPDEASPRQGPDSKRNSRQIAECEWEELDSLLQPSIKLQTRPKISDFDINTALPETELPGRNRGTLLTSFEKVNGKVSPLWKNSESPSLVEKAIQPNHRSRENVLSAETNNNVIDFQKAGNSVKPTVTPGHLDFSKQHEKLGDPGQPSGYSDTLAGKSASAAKVPAVSSGESMNGKLYHDEEEEYELTSRSAIARERQLKPLSVFTGEQPKAERVSRLYFETSFDDAEPVSAVASDIASSSARSTSSADDENSDRPQLALIGKPKGRVKKLGGDTKTRVDVGGAKLVFSPSAVAPSGDYEGYGYEDDAPKGEKRNPGGQSTEAIRPFRYDNGVDDAILSSSRAKPIFTPVKDSTVSAVPPKTPTMHIETPKSATPSGDGSILKTTVTESKPPIAVLQPLRGPIEFDEEPRSLTQRNRDNLPSHNISADQISYASQNARALERSADSERWDRLDWERTRSLEKRHDAADNENFPVPRGDPSRRPQMMSSRRRATSHGDVRRDTRHQQPLQPRPHEFVDAPLAVVQPGRSLQDAAFESITASLAASTANRGRSFQKPSAVVTAQKPNAETPQTYSGGVYRPAPMTFGKGRAGVNKSFDDSRTSGVVDGRG